MALLMAELPFMQIAAAPAAAPPSSSASSFRRFIDYTAWLCAHPSARPSVRVRPCVCLSTATKREAGAKMKICSLEREVARSRSPALRSLNPIINMCSVDREGGRHCGSATWSMVT